MGNYTIFWIFENPRRGRQARNFTTNVSKILDLKSSSEQIFFRNLSLGAPDDKGEELTNDFNLFHIDKNWSKLISYKTIPKKFLRTILLFPLFRRVICELFEKGG